MHDAVSSSHKVKKACESLKALLNWFWELSMDHSWRIKKNLSKFSLVLFQLVFFQFFFHHITVGNASNCKESRDKIFHLLTHCLNTNCSIRKLTHLVPGFTIVMTFFCKIINRFTARPSFSSKKTSSVFRDKVKLHQCRPDRSIKLCKEEEH